MDIFKLARGGWIKADSSSVVVEFSLLQDKAKNRIASIKLNNFGDLLIAIILGDLF